MSEQMISDIEKESLKFLERDFNQCFMQMRHYDAQLFDILKFMFTGYTALIGIAVGFFQFGSKEHIDLNYAVILSLMVGLIFGLFMLALVTRNRVYFVHVVRHINEQRELFYKNKPIGFENKSGMYTNCNQPPFYNYRSSHAWMMYIIASMNSTLLSILFFVAIKGGVCKLSIMATAWIFLFIVQLFVSIHYLQSRENKSASKAVFGKE
jgi:hypothetical protein